MRALALSMLLLSGCELIASIPTASTAVPGDGGDDALDAADERCMSNEDCTEDDARACLVAESTCVQCVVAGDCTEPTTPLCSGDHTCQRCTLDAECGANALCLPSGACAADTRVLYAAVNGAGAQCTVASPCTIEQAHASLTADKDIIKLAAGTYQLSMALTFNGTVVPRFSLLGVGAQLQTTSMFAITVTGGAALDVKGINFSGGLGAASCNTLGKLSIYDSTISGHVLGAVANECELNLERVLMRANTAYALNGTTNAVVNVRNSWIVANGMGSSTTPAVVMTATTGILEHTTIANNLSGAAGISCTDNAPNPAYVIRNSIVFGNAAPVTAACDVRYSNIEAGYAGTGMNNVTVDPQFVSTVNLHIQPTSPVRGLGDPANTLSSDLDGEARPQPAGSAPDLGADEIP